MKCPKCGKPITVTLPKKKWLYATKFDLEFKDENTRTIDAVLIFLCNNRFKYNVWICKECFSEWCSFHKISFGKWEHYWNLWFNAKEVVLFT